MLTEVNYFCMRIWFKQTIIFMNKLNSFSLIGLFVIAFSLISCNKENPDSLVQEMDVITTGLTISQAEELANLFAPLLDSNVKPDLDSGYDVYLTSVPKMYINLSRYEMPTNN